MAHLITNVGEHPLKKLSLEAVMEISNTLNLTKRKTKLFFKSMRQIFWKTIFEYNISSQIEELQRILSVFYSVKTESFISENEEISHSLVFLKDASDLTLCMINKRGLNSYFTAGISIDGGQGFLKCIENVFDPL